MTYEELRQHVAALGGKDQQIELLLRALLGESGLGMSDMPIACHDLACHGLLTYPEGYWIDLNVLLAQSKQGATLKPDYDYTNGGILFPQNDATEIIHFMQQIPHAWKPGTPLHPHIHWLQSQADVPVWKMKYRVLDAGQADALTFTTLTSTDEIFTYASGNLHQATRFPEIDMSGVTGPSPMLVGQLWREDNVVTGDVTAFSFDFHMMIDAPGYREELVR